MGVQDFKPKSGDSSGHPKSVLKFQIASYPSVKKKSRRRPKRLVIERPSVHEGRYFLLQILAKFSKNSEYPALVIPLESTTISSWSLWSECSVSCGEGRQSRERQCRQVRAKAIL